jgi:hypothetical protein
MVLYYLTFNIPMLQVVKYLLRNNFSMEDLGDTTYILDIKIYRDRSKKDNWIKPKYMQDSKKGLFSMSHGITLSIT